jgi:dinuclear metal center YbgI/SA1388 family protein
MSEPRVTVAELLRHLDDRFPFGWAEPWDRVGLLTGDPATEVSRVFVTLDTTPEAISMAVAHGANVLVSHHPAFLEPPAALTPAAAGAAFQAASMGISLVACHTNLDRAPAGADALPLAVGLAPGSPLENGRQAVVLITVYVPDSDATRVVEAMSAAGAGRIGEYQGCAFSGLGVGSFVPRKGSEPHVGTVGERSSAEEVRLEMVCEPRDAPRVVASARAAHPYEEPLIVTAEAAIARGAARLGRISQLAEPTTLRAFADTVASAFSLRPRVWGEPDKAVTSVATIGGSGGSAIGEALAAGASVLLTGEVRYHGALEALAAGLAIVEAGHDMTEWPLVGVLATALREHEGLAAAVVVDEPVHHWWTP